MKLLISFVTALSLGLTCTVLGDDEYSALAAKAYRWVTVNGPYACKTKQDVERITAHHTDAAELQVVENIECYYPIPGTIVQVIKEDPARGLSEMRLGSITRSLWTGALGSCVTFIMTITIIPFMPDGWAASAGGFPAMQGNVAFLMKDLVLFAVSFYLLKQDVERVLGSADSAKGI
jgi:hypothetical protein